MWWRLTSRSVPRLPGSTARAAHEQAGRFVDGSWLVELAPLSSGALVTTAVTQALDVKLADDTSVDALVKAVATRRALVVLDNCEHLIVLATSRKSLRSAGEQVVPLGPLDLRSPTTRR